MKKVTTDSQKGMRQYTLISSLPTNHFISSDQFSGHFSNEWLDWNNPKFKHFEWGRFCSKGYQSPNILNYSLKFVRYRFLPYSLSFLCFWGNRWVNTHPVVFSEKGWCTVASQSKPFESVWSDDTTVIPNLILGVNRRNET